MDQTGSIAMNIMERVVADMKTAMLGKEEARLSALRMIRAEFLKAEKEKGVTLDETRAMAILQTMEKQRRDSIKQFEAGGRPELAQKETSELAIISSYLPEPLSEDEIRSHVDAVLATLEAPDPKQMGKIVGQVMGRLKGTGRPFDAQGANAMVRARLGA
jgi:uncharacterized protein YqeY